MIQKNQNIFEINKLFYKRNRTMFNQKIKKIIIDK
jgi:hypothetical protein